MSNAIWHFDEGPVEKAGSFKNSSAASQNLGPRAAQSNRLSAARAPRAVAQKHPRPRPIQAAPPRRTYPLRGASGPSVQSGSRSERNPRAHGPPPGTGTCRWAVVRSAAAHGRGRSLSPQAASPWAPSAVRRSRQAGDVASSRMDRERPSPRGPVLLSLDRGPGMGARRRGAWSSVSGGAVFARDNFASQSYVTI
jgi:hypothetical protein